MRKFLYCFLSLMIVISSTQSAYAASPQGWTATAADTIMAGATATITAFKGAGSSAMKATIAHRPTAVAVGKELVKGGGALALAYAMSKLLDAGVDWVLDPANNRIKYEEAKDPNAPDPSVPLLWTSNVPGESSNYIYPTYQAAAAVTCSSRGGSVSGYRNVFTYTVVADCSNGQSWTVQSKPNPAYNPDAPTTDEKYIPIETVAQEVLEGAEAAHPASQEFVKGVALEDVNSGALDTPLEAVAEPTTDTPEPDAPTDPAEPFDPSGIMDLLKRILGALGLLTILGTISDTLTSFTDFFKDDPPANEADPVEVDPALVPDKSAADFDVEYINFGGQCPTLPSFDVGIGGASTNMAFDMSPLCDLAVKIRPAIIGIAYFIGLGIIASAIRET